jgi:tetratricopeptide (TPR) repeat protein
MADAIERARAHQAVIDDLWDYSDPALSEGRFRAAADAATDSIDRDILQTQVARALGLQDKFDDAKAVLDAISADDSEVRVRLLLEKGRVINSSGDSEGALPVFAEAFGAATEAEFEFLTIDAAHMLAIVAPADQHVALNEQALALATSSSDPRARDWRASLLNNLGWARFDGGDYAAALSLFEEAVVERDRMGKARELQIARWCVGRTLRALGRAQEALDLQLSLADKSSRTWVSDSFVEEEIGECLVELGQRDEARSHFVEAANLLEAAGAGEQPNPERLARLREQADTVDGSGQMSTTPDPGSG